MDIRWETVEDKLSDGSIAYNVQQHNTHNPIVLHCKDFDAAIATAALLNKTTID